MHNSNAFMTALFGLWTAFLIGYKAHEWQTDGTFSFSVIIGVFTFLAIALSFYIGEIKPSKKK